MALAKTDRVSVVKKQVVLKDNLILLRIVNFTSEFLLEIQSSFYVLGFFWLRSIKSLKNIIFIIFS